LVLGIHHFITSSGQKTNGTLGGASTSVVGTRRLASCSTALTLLTCLGLFDAFGRAETVFFFFFWVFVILGNALQRGTFRCDAILIANLENASTE